ncbi:MAG: MBL fold metallo-hydrolase [bacterium]
MELIIIGSGTGVLQTRRSSPGHILIIDNQIILLDGGTGTLRKCLEAGISYKDVDKICYTHLHPDHTIDLIPFLFATKHTPEFIRKKRLEIFGPIGIKSFYLKLTELYGTGITDVEYDIILKELSENKFDFGTWKLQTKLMKHIKNAIGYRFEENDKVFVYSGDTDYCEEIIELSRYADVLLIECSFPDHLKVPGHLTPTEAGKIASKAGVDKLILTHLYPPCDEEDILKPCVEQFNGSVIIAMDLMKIEI